jgi:hypothetical protein
LAATVRHDSRVLLASPALVVDGDDLPGRTRQVGDDEADAWIKLVRTSLDLGDHPARP